MGDLLQKQIRESCKLALPDGLKDLMSDISREVLRAQPQNLHQFITDYLSALLVARENLFIASRVCDDVCKSRCYPEMEDELHEVGLSDEDVEKTLKVVTEFFENGEVKETNLLIKLLKKTEIDETQLPAVMEAVRGAFLRHQENTTVLYESSSTDSDMDETLIAAKHTLKIYKKTKEPGDNYSNVVEKIQAAYRAYNVRRKFQRHNQERDASPSKKKTDEVKKPVYFDSKKVEQLFPETTRNRCSSKASSISLAGSYIPLPSYKPYSIDNIFEEDEICGKEKEHVSFDYTEHWKNSPEWQAPDDKKKDVSIKKKSISFHDLPQILNTNSEEATDEIPEEVVEVDDESEESDIGEIQEQLITDHGMMNCHDTDPMDGITKGENKDDIIEEILISEQETHEPVLNEYAFKRMEANAEATCREHSDNSDDKFTSEKVIRHIAEKSELLEENDKADDKDDDEINNKVLMNEVTDQINNNQMMWYGDTNETTRENSVSESRDGDNIFEYFDNESAAASFTD